MYRRKRRLVLFCDERQFVDCWGVEIDLFLMAIWKDFQGSLVMINL